MEMRSHPTRNFERKTEIWYAANSIDLTGLVLYAKNRQQQTKITSRDSVIIHLRSASFRAVLFALMWWMLTDGVLNSWLIGVPVVMLATSASVVIQPPYTWSLIGFLRFIPFFLWHSLRGGVDVAWRALHPRLPISPEIVEHRWRLPPGLPRVFMANTVSLLPGTLSAELDEEHLYVHVLDKTGEFAAELLNIEAHVSRVFGLSPADDGREEF